MAGPMADSLLPNWVYDLINAIDEYEEQHPSKLLRTIQGPSDMAVSISTHPDSPDFAGWSWCIDRIRSLVPSEVLEVARHIKRYQQHT